MPCACGCAIVTIKPDGRCICDGCGRDRTEDFLKEGEGERNRWVKSKGKASG